MHLSMKDKDFFNPLISFLNDLKELKLIEELTGRSFE